MNTGMAWFRLRPNVQRGAPRRVLRLQRDARRQAGTCHRHRLCTRRRCRQHNRRHCCRRGYRHDGRVGVMTSEPRRHDDGTCTWRAATTTAQQQHSSYGTAQAAPPKQQQHQSSSITKQAASQQGPERRRSPEHTRTQEWRQRASHASAAPTPRPLHSIPHPTSPPLPLLHLHSPTPLAHIAKNTTRIRVRSRRLKPFDSGFAPRQLSDFLLPPTLLSLGSSLCL